MRSSAHIIGIASLCLALCSCQANHVDAFTPVDAFDAQNRYGLVLLGLDTTGLSGVAQGKSVNIHAVKFNPQRGESDISCWSADEFYIPQEHGVNEKFYAFLVPPGTYIMSDHWSCLDEAEMASGNNQEKVCSVYFSIRAGEARNIGTISYRDDKHMRISATPQKNAATRELFNQIHTPVVAADLKPFAGIPSAIVCAP